MANTEILNTLCNNIRNNKLIISEEEQKRIDAEWAKWAKTSTQKRAMLDKQMGRVSQKK
ncbi:MAG: hypothetical protein MJ007_07600 [Paludibacteraceae bacterium]|nr:hypothetical protein [Paludibacteraceae bacterium]